MPLSILCKSALMLFIIVWYCHIAKATLLNFGQNFEGVKHQRHKHCYNSRVVFINCTYAVINHSTDGERKLQCSLAHWLNVVVQRKRRD